MNRVYINIEADSAEEARDEMAKLLRGHPAVAGSEKPLDFDADAADEAAETAAAKVDGKLTLDDVRNALGLYVGAFGMAAAQADGPVLIAKVLGVPHDPAAPKKISDLGEDQVLLKRAVDGVAEMIAKDPFKRAVAS